MENTRRENRKASQVILEGQEKPQTALINISAKHDFGNFRHKHDDIETLGEVSALDMDRSETKTPTIFFNVWHPGKMESSASKASPTFRRPVTTNKTIYQHNTDAICDPYSQRIKQLDKSVKLSKDFPR